MTIAAPTPPFSWRDPAPAVYLRIERQVVAPLDQRLSVFLIRVYVYDVAALEIAERARLRDNILSMTPEVAAYKSLIDEHGDHRERVAALLMSSFNDRPGVERKPENRKPEM